MADTMAVATESLELTETSIAIDEGLLITPRTNPPESPSQSGLNRRDKDSRDRRDERDRDRDAERPPSRYFDRNTSPPPRDREREYKRRRTPSPPSYRDRRHSPSRRSPPPYKRSKREDGNFDRRGSPRGGYGADDRRFNSDYSGAYDRAQGTRHWSHSRSGNRPFSLSQHWPPDNDFNRSGLDGSLDSGRGPREGLMSYKQFIQELEDDIVPAEAERRYEEYRSEYISTQKRNFFEAHKGEEWLKDKYHPTNMIAVIERRNEDVRRVVKHFMLDLQSGTLDLGPSVTPGNKTGTSSNPNSEDEMDGGGRRRRHGGGTKRSGDEGGAAPKCHGVSTEPRRIVMDIEQALALARKIDGEKGVEDNMLCSAENNRLGGSVVIVRGLGSVKGLEGAELLDTAVTYLWRVHGVDYYGMTESSSGEGGKGLRHVRPAAGDDQQGGGAEWETRVDEHWQERLKSGDPLLLRCAKEKIEAASMEVLDPYVRKIRDEKYGWKYGCGAKGCTKLFHAAEFVQKHLKLKHPELVLDLTSKFREDVYFQNYMSDPEAPGGKPVMQSPPHPRERIQQQQRHKTGMAGRLNRVDEWRTDDAERSSPSKGDERFPPVLMPVPGAGPLGPFVPAPPEVAMRMLMDQAPHDSNGGNSSSTSRPPPPLPPPAAGAPPPPILAVSPRLRHDPRRIRSYRDLDAPDDEVTVIDYRSL